MRRILILVFVIPLLALNTTTDKNQFIGKWMGEDQSEIGYISFDKEGYALFEIEGLVFGGKEFTFDGKKGRVTYEINDSSTPIEVDLILTKLESGEEKRVLCIANFINANEMQFALNFENKRPTDFTGPGAINLKRTK